MRTIDQIKREIVEAETQSTDPKLKGNKVYSADQQRKLYQARADALRVELAGAEKARQAIVKMAGTK